MKQAFGIDTRAWMFYEKSVCEYKTILKKNISNKTVIILIYSLSK